MVVSNEQTPSPSADIVGVPRVGDIIAGKYLVEGVLGRGGMGVVVAARHTALRQRVAVKFLLPRAAETPGAADRFLREAQSAVAIQNEHVARVTDVGTLESGSPYMVMEYLTGTDLERTVEARGPLPVEEAVDYILQACEAIAEAHALGIVHRDLKPGNLFLTARSDGSPLVKVLDFGLSKAMAPDAPGGRAATTTSTDMVAGSPAYMSPEQVRSLRNVDARTDIWALGVILYELLTSRLPFEGESAPAILVKVSVDPPELPRTFRPDLSLGLEAILLRCLEKDIGRRIQTVAELAQALVPFGPERARVSVERILRMRPETVNTPAPRPSWPGDRISALPQAPGTHAAAHAATHAAARVTPRITPHAPLPAAPLPAPPNGTHVMLAPNGAPQPTGPTTEAPTLLKKITPHGSPTAEYSAKGAAPPRGVVIAAALGTFAVLAVVVTVVLMGSRPDTGPDARGDTNAQSLGAAPKDPADLSATASAPPPALPGAQPTTGAQPSSGSPSGAPVEPSAKPKTDGEKTQAGSSKTTPTTTTATTAKKPPVTKLTASGKKPSSDPMDRWQ